MTETNIDYDDAAAIGFKISEACDRVKVAHAVIPGSQAVWFLEADDVRYKVVVTVDDVAADRPEPAVSDGANQRGSILRELIREYKASGHETFEYDGHVFARLLAVEHGRIASMTDVDLTRLSAAIDRRLP